MQTQPLYRVVFSGALADGFDPASAKDALVSRLGLKPDRVDLLLAKRRQVLKRVASRKQGERYVRLLRDAGLQACVEPVTADADDSPSGLPPFRPFPDHWLYKPVLVATAGIELALTLGYGLLLLGLLGALFYQALFSDWLLAWVPGAVAAAIHTLLVVAGVALVALLLKPLLALPRGAMPGLPVAEAAQPDLHAFVADLCEAVGVAPPTELRLCNDASMEARYRRGWRGVGRGETRLSLGLPLVASLSSRQVAGAVAQAMQPFDPLGGPRLGALIEAQLAWLQRAVHEPDAVDRRLQAWRAGREEEARLLRALAAVAAAARRPVRLRLALSRRLCARLVHRRVADADAAGGRFAGSAELRRMLEERRLLAFAAAETLPRLRETWAREGRLPASLPHAVVARASRHPPELRNLLQRAQEQRIAARGEAVPGDRQRLARLERLELAPAYRCESDAAVLCRQPERLMQTLTLHHYHRELRLPVSRNDLVRTPAEGSPEAEAEQRLAAFFGGAYRDRVALELGRRVRRYTAGGDAASRWRRAVAGPAPGEAGSVMAALDGADAALVGATCRETAVRASLGARLGQLARGNGTPESAHRACREAEQAFDAARDRAQRALRPAATRLAAALALLDHPQVRERVPEAARWSGEAERLVRTFETVEGLYPQLRALRLHGLVLESVLGHEGASDAASEQADDIARLRIGIGAVLKKVPYPLAEGPGTGDLRRWVARDCPEGEAPPARLDQAIETVRRLELLQRLILGQLVDIATRLEAAAGLTRPAA